MYVYALAEQAHGGSTQIQFSLSLSIMTLVSFHKLRPGGFSNILISVTSEQLSQKH